LSIVNFFAIVSIHDLLNKLKEEYVRHLKKLKSLNNEKKIVCVLGTPSVTF